MNKKENERRKLAETRTGPAADSGSVSADSRKKITVEKCMIIEKEEYQRNSFLSTREFR